MNSSGVAGQVGAGRVEPWRLPDKGEYEVWFGDVPDYVLRACYLRHGSRRHHLKVDLLASCKDSAETGCRVQLAEEDLIASGQYASNSAMVKDERLIVLWQGWWWRSEEVLELSLELGPDGFVGTGTATLERHCGDDPMVTYEVPVTIAPRHTGPQFYFVPDPELAPYAVTWGPVKFWADEAVNYPPLYAMLSDPGIAPIFALQPVADLLTRTAVEHCSTEWPAIRVLSPGQVAGTQQVPLFVPVMTDMLGNTASMDPTPIVFAEDQVIVDSIDFDQIAPKGLIGAGGYYPAGTVHAPCESGGCAVIGPVRTCRHDGNPSFFSIRVNAAHPVLLKLRMAIQASSPLTVAAATWVEGEYFIHASISNRPDFAALAEPDGAFAYSTGFFDTTLAPQSPHSTGGALTFDCFEGYQDATARMVVERITVIPDESRQ